MSSGLRGAAMGVLLFIAVPVLLVGGLIGLVALPLAAAFYVLGIVDGRAIEQAMRGEYRG